MIYDEALLALEDQCDQLIIRILESEAMVGYLEAKQRIESSEEAQLKIEQFKRKQEQFELIEAYGEYAPDFLNYRQQLYQAKREMDLDEVVYEFRIAERQLQVQLDLVADKLAKSVSTNILVSAGDAFSLSLIGLPTACEIHLGKRKDIEL